jgi:pimeloyl-ACP methyl ester carboxylesterase
LALLGFCAPAVTSAGPVGVASVTCQVHSVPVTLGLVPATMRGTLCVPGPEPVTAVQVLLHGGSYNSAYWDFPYQPEKYSYVRAANFRGYATFNVDRIGYGQSSRPVSLLLTADGHAATIHQVVGKLRAGQIGEVAFDTVLLAGHSLGAGIALLESASYDDVDAVVLSGMTHHLSTSGLIQIITADTHPAALDPKFGLGYEGYLTSVPGTRDDTFHSPVNAVPAVVALDEQLKDVESATEVVDVITDGFTLPVSLAVDVPVLLAVGSRDWIFCTGSLASNCASAPALSTGEAPYFSPDACLRTYVLPDAGHSLNLSVDTEDYQDAVHDWADAVVSAAGCP